MESPQAKRKHGEMTLTTSGHGWLELRSHTTDQTDGFHIIIIIIIIIILYSLSRRRDGSYQLCMAQYLVNVLSLYTSGSARGL